MIYGENFNAIFDALSRIEQHIGLNSSNDDISVNGRLNQIMTSEVFRGGGTIEPYCEVDILIVGNNFTVTNEPVLIGNSWVMQNTATIMVSQDASAKHIEEWFDIEFDGSTGTLVGADNKYDGKFITVTYFHSNLSVYYAISFSNGIIDITRTSENILNLVIRDIITETNYRITVDSKGRISNIPTADEEIGDSLIEDSVTGDIYEIYIENAYMNWRII